MKNLSEALALICNGNVMARRISHAIRGAGLNLTATDVAILSCLVRKELTGRQLRDEVGLSQGALSLALSKLSAAGNYPTGQEWVIFAGRVEADHRKRRFAMNPARKPELKALLRAVEKTISEEDVPPRVKQDAPTQEARSPRSSGVEMHEKIGEDAAPESLSRPAAGDSIAAAPSGGGPPEDSPAATAVTAPAPVAAAPPISDVTGVSSPPQRGVSPGTRKKRGTIPAQDRLQGELF